MLIIRNARRQHRRPRPPDRPRDHLNVPRLMLEVGAIVVVAVRLSGSLLALWLLASGLLSVAVGVLRTAYGAFRVLAGMGVIHMLDSQA